MKIIGEPEIPQPVHKQTVDKQIVIDTNPYRTRVALLEDGKTVELHIEQRSNDMLVGNIYKGRVSNVLPGMEAAFVDISEDKNAFLYVGDKQNEQLPGGAVLPKQKNPHVCPDVKPGQEIMVQIVKEPHGTKGARVSTQIYLPGHLLVFLPMVDFIGISKRITNEAERARLRGIIEKCNPPGTGAIVRTAAEGRGEAEIAADIQMLAEQWAELKRIYKVSPAPKLIRREESLLSRTIRDLLKADIRSLVVNDRTQYYRLLEIAEDNDPALADRIELRDGETNLFDVLGIEDDIIAALSRKVWLKSGAYLVIDQTEALVSIDVNTGKNVGKASLRKTIAETNCEAAVEIARQLRLRDLSGIIIIDFIDMEEKEDKETVLATLREALRGDRMRSVILGMTELGFVELTRKKLRANLADTLQTTCPYCKGSGKVLNAETVALKIRSALIARVSEGAGAQQRFTVAASPTVAALLREHSREELRQAFPGVTLEIVSDESMHLEHFSIRTQA